MQPFTGVLTCSCPAGARCLPRGPTTSGSSACAQAQRKHNTQLKGCLLFPAPAGARYLPRGPTTSGSSACAQAQQTVEGLFVVPCPRRCTVSAEGPHNFRHNCSLPVLQTDKTPIHGARSEEPGEGPRALYSCTMPAKLCNACAAVQCLHSCTPLLVVGATSLSCARVPAVSVPCIHVLAGPRIGTGAVQSIQLLLPAPWCSAHVPGAADLTPCRGNRTQFELQVESTTPPPFPLNRSAHAAGAAPLRHQEQGRVSAQDAAWVGHEATAVRAAALPM